MKAEEILRYGIQQFEEENYDAALEAMTLAYMKGHEQEWIINTIYSCYVDGNDIEFRRSYDECVIYKDILYEDCSLDFIPYREGEYYIYDKIEGIFLGLIDASDIKRAEKPEREFDDVAAEFDWDWRKYGEILQWSTYCKVYVICHDRNRAASFCKIPELAGCFQRIKAFSDRNAYQQYFHSHTGVYLPRTLIGDGRHQRELERIWQEEHAYRLTPEGRNTDHILLSIGIPTHDRGHLALKNVKKLLEMVYDAEIEIMVSKNGTTLYQEEYRQIGEISDARLHYFDHNKELTMALSWRKTVELAKGQYVLLVSDEDNVIISALDHYLSVLARYPELAFVRSRTVQQYNEIDKTIHCKKGLEAFSKAFLGNNYLSGAIVRRESFIGLPFDEIDNYASNIVFYNLYCHEWWFSLLSFEGDFRKDSVFLIEEGECQLDVEGKEYVKRGFDKDVIDAYQRDGELLPYATYMSRLDQFKGYISFVHFIENNGSDIVGAGVYSAISKTAYLLRMAYEYGYRRDEIADVLRKYSEFGLQAIDEFSFNNAQKDFLIYWLADCIEYVVNGGAE